MIDQVKEFILDLCKDQNWDWERHIRSVVNYSEELVKMLHFEEFVADKRIVEASAWLHDMGKLDGHPKEHHKYGEHECRHILIKAGYCPNDIAKIGHCILTHSSDNNYVPFTIEAKILASADGMSHFDNLLALADYTFRISGLSVDEARDQLVDKYENSWNKMMPIARGLVKHKYDAIKIVLGIEK